MNKDDFAPALELAARLSLEFQQGLGEGRVTTTADIATLRQRLGKTLGDEGLPPTQVVEELAADLAPGLLRTGDGRFFGWVIGGVLPGALAADWLASAWDQNAAMVACAPAVAVAEEVVGAWLKDVLGLPAEAGFALVTGCNMAHVTCLAAARHALLACGGWDVEEQGLCGAPRVRILTSRHRHGSFERAVRLVGFGLANIHTLASDDHDRLRPEALEAALAADPEAPTLVLLQAGDINIGAFDDFPALIPIARRHGAWVHVDGAFGLWAQASPAYRHLSAGVENADSWATDGHKWLNVPFDCGYAFIADAAAQKAALAHRAPYLTHAADARDQLDWNPEWSRRARALPTYAALRELGRCGVATLVETCCRRALELVDGIGQLPGAEIAWRPTLNQGLLTFPDPRPGAEQADHDARVDQVIATIQEQGDAYFGGSTWHGRRVMRVSVCNWRTGEAEVERSIAAVAAALRSLG